MSKIDYEHLSVLVRNALRATFTELLATNAGLTFYTFAVFTDDSLQFAYPVANTEEGLAATVERYNKDVDPKYGMTSTRNGMRWSYGDWQFFPDAGEQHFDQVAEQQFEQINSILTDNFCEDEEVFMQQVEPLWQSMLDGFSMLEQEGFFGNGPERSKVTLMLVGHVPDETVDLWVEKLNPPDVAKQFLEWDCDAAD